jgi:hypothetical protein
LREDVRSLLNAIEAKSPYFDRVNALKKKVQNTFEVPDFLPLSEILQVRRDFWAASEIFLMDDIQSLGKELTEAQTYDSFRQEARTLLFREQPVASSSIEDTDPVELRLAIALEEANAFRSHVEQTIAAQLEKSRFPTTGEIMAVPLGIVRGIALGVRDGRHLLADAAATAQSLARVVTLKGYKGAAEELRRVRGDLPEQFATAFERAGGVARKGGENLKRHYEFVLEAQELRARYAELLAHAPEVTEKGKQFLARLELEKRAEQFRSSSGDAVDWARQQLVVGIAHLIAGLQYAQAKITPLENKQLVVRPAEFQIDRAPPAAEPEEAPLRVLLLPASAYSGGNNGKATEPVKSRIRKARRVNLRPNGDVSKPRFAHSSAGLRLRDLVTGNAALDDDYKAGDRPFGSQVERKPRLSHSDGLMKTSFKELLAESGEAAADENAAQVIPLRPQKDAARTSGDSTGSLLDRLSKLAPTQGEDKTEPEVKEPKFKNRTFRLFKSRRN